MSSTKKSIQSAYVGSKSMELPMSYFVRIRKHDQILPELNELGFPRRTFCRAGSNSGGS